MHLVDMTSQIVPGAHWSSVAQPVQMWLALSHVSVPPASAPRLQSASFLHPASHVSLAEQYVPAPQTSSLGVHATHAPVVVSQTLPIGDAAQSLSSVHIAPPSAP